MAFTITHPDITVETNNASGLIVFYDPATPAGGLPPYSAISYGSHVSGTTFPVGLTTVEMSVDDATPSTVTGTFTVTVALVDVVTIDPPVRQWQLLRSDTKPRGEQSS